MKDISRREFVKRGLTGIALGATSGAWFNADAYAAGAAPGAASVDDRFGVSREDMMKILEVALSKGGDFADLFFEYRIANSVRMEEDIIRDSSESIARGVGIRVLKGAQTGYGYTDDLSVEKMKQAALTAAAIAAGSPAGRLPDLAAAPLSRQVYDLHDPLYEMRLQPKIDLLREAYDAANPAGTRQRFASPGLFAAMGTALIKGRDFGTGDLPNRVLAAIVNRVFVERYLKGRDPIGVQFSAGYPAPDPRNEVTIVGRRTRKPQNSRRCMTPGIGRRKSFDWNRTPTTSRVRAAAARSRRPGHWRKSIPARKSCWAANAWENRSTAFTRRTWSRCRLRRGRRTPPGRRKKLCECCGPRQTWRIELTSTP